MKIDIKNGIVNIDICDMLDGMSIEEKKDLLNIMKIKQDFYKIFMEELADLNTDLNDRSRWTSETYERRKTVLNGIYNTFKKELPSLRIINDLEEKFRGYESTDGLYWHIYHKAPDYIKEYFQGVDCFKSGHYCWESGKKFKQELIEFINKQP